MNKILELTITLTSDNTFDVEFYEPESGLDNIIHCHDNGNETELENRNITDEIRSWASIMREETAEQD